MFLVYSIIQQIFVKQGFTKPNIIFFVLLSQLLFLVKYNSSRKVKNSDSATSLLADNEEPMNPDSSLDLTNSGTSVGFVDGKVDSSIAPPGNHDDRILNDPALLDPNLSDRSADLLAKHIFGERASEIQI